MKAWAVLVGVRVGYGERERTSRRGRCRAVVRERVVSGRVMRRKRRRERRS